MACEGIVAAVVGGHGHDGACARDAIFSRQRYWGEPFPVYYRDGIPCGNGVFHLHAVEIQLGGAGIDHFSALGVETLLAHVVELNTMPGFAGSSAYYLRYMDPHNDRKLVGSPQYRWRLKMASRSL